MAGAKFALRRTSTLLKTGLGVLLVSGTLVGLSSCGPNYALFRVSVSSSTTKIIGNDKADRAQVTQCQMTITDEQGKLVLDKYQLTSLPSSDGSSLIEGCLAAKTGTKIATFEYSSSRSGGSLNFWVEATDDNFKRLQCGSSGPVQVAAYPPEIQVVFSIGTDESKCLQSP